MKIEILGVAGSTPGPVLGVFILGATWRKIGPKVKRKLYYLLTLMLQHSVISDNNIIVILVERSRGRDASICIDVGS